MNLRAHNPLIYIVYILSFFSLLCPFAAAAVGTITSLGNLGVPNTTTAIQSSSDGSTVVGSSFNGAEEHAIRWTQATGIADLGVLAGGITSRALTVNSNGSAIAGFSDIVGGDLRAFRWTSAGGMVNLGTVAGDTGSFALAISADGSTVVGESNNGAATQPFRWTQAGGMVSLGSLGGTTGSANSVSADGSIVAGTSHNGVADRAFRWTQAGGIVSLGSLGGAGDFSRATAISSDGTAVVGDSNTGAETRAFRWTQATGIQQIVTPVFVDSFSSATAVSPDGSTVIGSMGRSSIGVAHAYRWQSGVTIDFGELIIGGSSSALAMNSDGSVVVGQVQVASGNRGMRWTQATGMQTVEDWLRDNGATIPVDVTLNAIGVSPDGNTVYGNFVAGDAYIATISSNGGGIISLSNLLESLSGMSLVAIEALNTTNLIINGMHGHPLSSRIMEGDTAFWASGDWGKTNISHQNGRVAVGEIGGAYLFYPCWQLGFGMGGTHSHQNMQFDGRARSNGTYLLTEIIGELPLDNLWLTATALYHIGDVNIQRGYLNGNTPNFSRGDTQTRTPVTRARLDWENLLEVKQFGLTPYGEMCYFKTRVANFNEQGGLFPAEFALFRQNQMEGRLGVNATWCFPQRAKIIATLETVRNFKKVGSVVNGQLIGTFNFSLPPQILPRNWVHTALGFEAYMCNGVATVFLNAASRGQDPKMWIAASYRLEF